MGRPSQDQRLGIDADQGAGISSDGRAAASRRVPAQPPYFSGDKGTLVNLAKTPLSNLDALVKTLVPGAEITTEGLLIQFSDEELIMFAYALEQISDAASMCLVKDLKEREELRSTCMHRREYLQLLDGALGNRG